MTGLMAPPPGLLDYKHRNDWIVRELLASTSTIKTLRAVGSPSVDRAIFEERLSRIGLIMALRENMERLLECLSID